MVKTIRGTTATDEVFAFTMEAGAANLAGASFTADAGARTASVTGAGTANFAEIAFTEPGMYMFTIKETDSGILNWTYDDGIWTLTVVVADTDGKLTVTSTSYSDGTANNNSAAEFENVYTVPGSLTIVKTVTADADAKEFTFTVTGSNGYSRTVTVTGNGRETLTDLVPGEYTMTVEAGKTAVTTISSTYTREQSEVGSLTVTKAVSGGGEEADGKIYTFTVTGPNGSSTTVTVTGNGSTTLTELVPGTYTVTEAPRLTAIAGEQLVAAMLRLRRVR